MAEAADCSGAGGPTRRAMLAAAVTGSLLLAGCKGIAALGPLPAVSPEVTGLELSIAAEELMVVTYGSALTALAGDAKAAGVVAGVLAEHQAHLAALRARLALPPRLATAKPGPGPAQPSMPSDPRQVLERLASAEHAAAGRLTLRLREAPPALAELMASIAASEAAHVVVLGQAGLA